MCRWELEDSRPSTQSQSPNILTPVSAEQIITEEISYFPNAAHAQSISLSRHPKRRLKDLLRVFGFTLLRSVAEYVHDENMPAGWYDDGESEESDDSEDSDESNENGENEGETDDETNEEVNEEEEHDPETGFIIDTHGQRQTSRIVGDLRQHIGT
jgi:TATA-binding protein-associated factor Taf7